MITEEILNMASKLNKMYKIIYNEIMTSPLIQKRTQTDPDGLVFDTIGFFDNGKTTRITYLDTNNELLSNSETIVKRMLDECRSLNDTICNALAIDNKLDKFPIDLTQKMDNGDYEFVIKVYLENIKYIQNKYEELKKVQKDELTKDLEKVED